MKLQHAGQIDHTLSKERLTGAAASPGGRWVVLRMHRTLAFYQTAAIAVGKTSEALRWQAGEHAAAIRLEMLWNQLAHTENDSLLCGYTMGHFYKDAHFDDVCGQHTHVVLADGEAAPMPHDRRVLRRGEATGGPAAAARIA